ncbi:hypothetical protein DJICPGNB_08145 [Escherichia coli]|nr:hypothetical protein DJICPGNB_08145 [Escherichia coli]
MYLIIVRMVSLLVQRTIIDTPYVSAQLTNILMCSANFFMNVTAGAILNLKNELKHFDTKYILFM